MNKLFLAAVFMLALLFTTACSIPFLGNNTLSKEQIISLAMENEELLLDVVREIESFEGEIELISTVQRSRLYSASDVGSSGLFIIADTDFGAQEKPKPQSIENDVFQRLMDLNGVIEVSISRSPDVADAAEAADANEAAEAADAAGAPDILIEFSCTGQGFGANTSYYGFYYTATDNMTAIWCCGSGAELKPEGNGWVYNEPGGDNTYYTENITGHFYYYEAHF